MKLSNKAVNLDQLRLELATAGIAVSGLGLTDGELHTYGNRTATRTEHELDDSGEIVAAAVVSYEETGVPVDFVDEAAVAKVLAAHVPTRLKTDDEYRAEFEQADETRKQTIRDILLGLAPRETAE